MERQYKTVDSKIEVVADRKMSFTISTGSVDRDGDTIDPKGWQLDNYRKNPQVLFGHDYHSLPVGKAIEVKSTDKALHATVEFPPKGVYPFADQVYDMLKGGFLNATSVGFQALEHEPATDRKGYNIRKQELLEFSIVPIPSNPEALVSQRGITSDQATSWKKELLAWAAKDQSKALLRVKKALPSFEISNQANWDLLEKDFEVESETGDLSDARLIKLLSLHGFEKDALQIKSGGGPGCLSEDHTQADAQREFMRMTHGAIMDGYANAHYAEMLCDMMRTSGGEELKAISGHHKNMIEDTRSAVSRTKGHLKTASDHYIRHGKSLGLDLSKDLAPTKEAIEAIQKCIKCDQETKQTDSDLWFELEESKMADDEYDIPEDKLMEVIGSAISAEVGTAVKDAINKRLGRLD